MKTISKAFRGSWFPLFFLACLLLSHPLFADSKVIKGVLKDSKTKETIIGATIQVVGTTSGTSSNLDGEFTLRADSEARLKITYIGYDDLIISASAFKNGQVLEVLISEKASVLNEVVVTGYGGTQKRSKVTNAIAKVDTDVFSKSVFSNPAQALSGAVAGLKVYQTSGNPGATPTIVLRGGTNFDGSGSPLVVVDGQLRSSLSDINPNDIESMDILKDAGATALYGARASDGVILITTKSGKDGRRSINFKASYGLNYMNNPYTFVGARDYLNYQRRAQNDTPWLSATSKSNYLNGNRQPSGTGNVYGTDGSGLVYNVFYADAVSDAIRQNLINNHGWETMPDPLDPTKTLLFKDTRPQDYNFNNPAKTTDYNLSMSGGNDKGNYYSSLGYNKSEGAPLTSFYERYNFTFNGSYKVADFITTTSNFSFNRANWRSMPGSQTNENEYFGRIRSLPATVRFVDEAGNPVLGPSHRDGNQAYQPDKWMVDNESNKFTMVQAVTITPIKNLSIKLSGNWYYDESVSESFTKDFEQTPGVFNRTRNSSAAFGRVFTQTYNAVASYNFTPIQDHDFDLMLGSEYYDAYDRGISAAGSGAPTDDFADLGLTTSDKDKRSIDTRHTKSRILSYFGRLNYDYQDKYLLSGVFRYDGYSSLLGSNRWGFFPGVSAGWVFGRESFVKDALPWLSFGKLRASFGVNGNASGIGAYTLQGAYVSTKYDGRTGYYLSTLPNPGLRWERTRTFDVGVDLSFLQNRLTTNFTFYDRLTSDKYADLSLPSTTGFSSIRSNNGELRNRGIELELNARVLTGAVNWTVGGNISYNKNTVVKLPDNGLARNRQGGQEVYTGRQLPDGSYERVYVGGYQEGQEPGVLVGYVADGIFQSADEIPAGYRVESGNAQGKHQVSPATYAGMTASEQANVIPLRAGDMRWKDINGDGKIDSFDQVVLGNTTPHWTGGFNSTLSWQGLTLTARMDFAFGYKIYDNTRPWFVGNMQGSYAPTTDVFNTWSETNRGATLPRYVWADQLGAGNYYRTSSLFVYDGAYLAFREVSLSYSLPKHWVKKIFAQDISFSVTGKNLGYLTAADVASPERSSAGSGYALPRTLLFGINITY